MKSGLVPDVEAKKKTAKTTTKAKKGAATTTKKKMTAVDKTIAALLQNGTSCTQ